MKIAAETAAVDLESLVAEVADRFTEEVKLGRSPSIEEYAECHPQIAHIIRQVFPALTVLDDVTASGLPDGKEVENIAGVLGDFRIVRELGRGGMGVVYEAEQISLSRRVALKVLPFASMLDKQQLARFKNEARAAATLDHPNIVAIYSVGCERGVHFYAMQLVDGPSLAETIVEMKAGRTPSNGNTDSPEVPGHETVAGETLRAALSTLRSNSGAAHFQTVARLGIQAAEALDHAHQSGILHRDIKPANLLLDDTGKLWITDFGLARIEADAGMTMTGDLLGTLRYMSPEQTLAKRVVVDHRSDIYSLGVTLYELLTLQFAYGAEDRHELLRQIAFEDPRKPRQLNSRIPLDLETIVLKSVEKNPADRYLTAQQFADDLRRFIANEPIRARLASPAQRLLKWSRRHVGVVWSALAVSLLAMVILGISTALIAQSRNEADEQRLIAVDEKEGAATERNVAVEERNKARLNQYYAEIVSGQTDWEHRNVSGLRTKLMAHLPAPKESDNRRWEWYYLLSLCHHEVRTIRNDFVRASAACSPDGSYIGSAGRIWKSDSGERIHSYDPSSTLSLCAAWSPNGQKFAWGHASDDDAFYVWDRATDAIERFAATPMAGQEGSVKCLDWSPDGKQIASGQIDHTVKIWDVATKSILNTIPVGGNVGSVVWSPDAKLLVAVVSSAHLKIVTPATGEIAVNLPGFGGQVSWHPDGKVLAVADAKRWYLLNRADWSVKCEQSLPRGGGPIACGPNGKQIAVAHGETVTIWDAEGKKRGADLNGHTTSVNSVTWARDSCRLVTSSVDGEIKIWDLKSQFQPAAISFDSNVDRLGWLPDNKTLVATDQKNGSAFSCNISDGTIKKHEIVVEKPLCISASRRFAAQYADSQHAINIIDTESGNTRSVLLLRPEHKLRFCEFSPDDSKLVVASVIDTKDFLDFWDIDAERHISSWDMRGRSQASLRAIAWANDGSRVALIGPGDEGDNGAYAWSDHLLVVNVHDGKRELKYRANVRSGLACKAWSPDGKSIALGTPEGRVEVVDLASRRAFFSTKIHDGGIHAIAWHPDGNRLACGTDDGDVKLIASSDGQPLLSFSLADKSKAEVAWSADGKRLAAATQIGSAQVWDASRGYEFTADGRRRDELAQAYYVRAGAISGKTTALDLQMMLAQAPDAMDFWHVRGSAFARLGAFDRAADEFTKLIASNPRYSLIAMEEQAYCLLANRDVNRFRESCASIVALVRDSPVHSNKSTTAWLCSLTQNPLVDSKEVVAFAATDEDPGDSGLLTIGAARFRDRQFNEAVRILTGLSEKLGRGGDATDHYELACSQYFLAMARHKLGQDHQARRFQALADRTSDESRQMSSNWCEKIVLNALRREVETELGRRNGS